MRVDLDRDPVVLRALGLAQNGQIAITDVLNQDGKLIAYEVDPSVDLRSYAKTATELSKAPVDVPATVWDWQFIGQAESEGIITPDESDAWLGTGEVPASLMGAVKASVTDADRQRRVLLFLKGATQFPRGHELTPLLAASFGKDTPEKVDAFFVAAEAR